MVKRPTVCIFADFEPDLVAAIEENCRVRFVDMASPRVHQLAALHNAQGVLLNPLTPADTEFFEAAPRLRVLSTASVGYDTIHVAEATRRGVVVCHTPGVLTAAVADLTMVLVISLARRLFDNERYVRSGGWARGDPLPELGSDVGGKTLGVVGFGRIGQEVTRRMQGFGMRTLWYDAVADPHPQAPASRYRPLDELLRESDFVTVHADLNDASRHLIGAEELQMMKPTAYLINTARGGLVDQRALTEALRGGSIAGAALDVLETEPPAPDDPLLRLPNVVCLPHIGTATTETRRRMRELAVQNLLAALAGEIPPAIVNPEVVTGDW
ncbi:MAG: D-glycerate dehydrogenase [bacterium]|nr:D-glycerate dehydrogenase [bacterium]MDE0287876.1 D-glycerate dehydrogenase [bacterium]